MTLSGLNTAAQYRAARWAVTIGIAVALAGSAFGLVFGVMLGPVSGPESWLIASCVFVSGVLLAMLIRKPGGATSEISAMACLYFGLYLCAGTVITTLTSADLLRVLPYLLWFYPLLAFNKFTNFGRYGAFVHWFIAIAPAGLLIALAGFVWDRIEGQVFGVVVVFLLSYLSYSLLLNLFSRYRESYAVGIARADDLERTSLILRESEERFRRLFDDAGAGLGSLDVTGRIQWANRAFIEMIGREPPVEGVLLEACLHADDRTHWQSHLKEMTRLERRPHTFEGRLEAKDGRLVDFEGSFVVAPARGALPDSIIFVGQDVTAKRELAARLQQSQKLEAIGQLTGGVAHDFNNLLTVILGNAETLAENLSENDKLRILAETTVKAAERGAELTSRLLAFARRQPLDPRATDINRQIAGMDQLLRRSLGEQIEIEFVQAAGLWKAMVDPGQFENAILNLCINARDAMLSGGGRLTLEVANVSLDQAYSNLHGDIVAGQYVMVAITDNGEGMTAQTLARAFEPFFTTKDVGKGSGLGLSMVYGFVKQSLGHVKVYSEPGHGTCVKIYLPRSTDDAAAVSPALVERPAPTGHEKILLAEDDALLRNNVSTHLRSLGYTVVAVKDGHSAMEVIRQTADFDLLFTDVIMPGGMNGPQLAEAARQLQPSLPVLFTSGYTENAVVHHGRVDRGVHLLQKPYRKQALAEKIRQVIDSCTNDPPV